MSGHLRRSCLSVPASSTKMLDKARGIRADEVLLDLEDSVAPADKNDDTRARVVEALSGGDWLADTLAVRVNAVTTPWCLADVERVVGGAGARVDSIILPKVEDESHVHFLDHLLSSLETAGGLERRIGIEVQIETARGIVNVERIASASPRIESLIFGPGDYAASIGIPLLSIGMTDPGYPGDQMHYPLSRIATTARAFGLQAIDGPYAAIRDLDGLRASARRSRLLGFDGKWVVHPDQVEACNEIFSPTQEEYDAAERLLGAYRTSTDETGNGAVLFGGEMIDEASRKMALSIAARGKAAGMTPANPHE
jgi:citrate lyase subunit beta/citryl-CoA lyase